MSKRKNKRKKRYSKKELDKISFEKRLKVQEKLRQEAVYTKSFRSRQSFGAASECKSLTIDEYLQNGGDPKILLGVINEK